MTAADLECLSFDELEDELATLASHIFAGTCRWLELVAELERRGGLSGCTTAEWLAWRCGLTPGTAREHVRVLPTALIESPKRDFFGCAAGKKCAKYFLRPRFRHRFQAGGKVLYDALLRQDVRAQTQIDRLI